MAEELETVLADMASDADALERTGNLKQAEYLRGSIARLRAAAEGWLIWLSEPDALIRSGFQLDWLRGRFEALRREGHARMVGRNRQYRMCAIPRKANVVTAARRGREAAREAMRKRA